MPPLLQRLSERKPETLDYLGVSFGLTKDLLRFWKKLGFVPLYASQKENALTGEYSFVMLKQLASAIVREEGWLGAFSSGKPHSMRFLVAVPLVDNAQDFRQRFMSLLSYPSFAKFDSSTALSILSASPSASGVPTATSITSEELNTLLSPFDMKRLETYTGGMLDYHVILDLVPSIAQLYFSKRLGTECSLSAAQQAILLALGLQRKPVEALEGELGVTSSQTLALFGKIMRRIVKHLQDIRKEGAGREIPLEQPGFERAANGNGTATDVGGTRRNMDALDETVEEELGGDAKAVSQEMRQQRDVQRELLDSVDMRQ